MYFFICLKRSLFSIRKLILTQNSEVNRRENVLSYSHTYYEICDLTLPPGIGDKKILRDAAKMVGCEESASLVKRAIQFGTRMAHKKVAGYVKLTSEMSTAQLVNPEQIQNPDDPEEILTVIIATFFTM